MESQNHEGWKRIPRGSQDLPKLKHKLDLEENWWQRDILWWVNVALRCFSF